MKQINLAPIHKDTLGGAGYGAFPNNTTTCYDCGTSTTSLWRRDSMGNSVCNACRLYFLHHNKKRPTTSVPHIIRRRNRKKSIKSVPKIHSPTKLAPMSSWPWNPSQSLPSIENIHSLTNDHFRSSYTPLIECRPVDDRQFEYSTKLSMSSPTSESASYHFINSQNDSHQDSFNDLHYDRGISYSCLQASLALLELANLPVHSTSSSSSPATTAPPPSPR